MNGIQSMTIKYFIKNSLVGLKASVLYSRFADSGAIVIPAMISAR
jgi:hypothetical protein